MAGVNPSRWVASPGKRAVKSRYEALILHVAFERRPCPGPRGAHLSETSAKHKGDRPIAGPCQETTSDPFPIKIQRYW